MMYSSAEIMKQVHFVLLCFVLEYGVAHILPSLDTAVWGPTGVQWDRRANSHCQLDGQN